MVSVIVAVDNKWGIGYNGELLERIPEDLKNFKKLTRHNIIVMGRKTWDSLPNKPLDERLNIVITSGEKSFDAFTAFISMEEAKVRLSAAAHDHEDEWFIIGGGQIYKELLQYADRVYVTKILKDHDNVDTYFPNLDKSDEWKVSLCTELREYNGIQYAFLTYDKIS